MSEGAIRFRVALELETRSGRATVWDGWYYLGKPSLKPGDRVDYVGERWLVKRVENGNAKPSVTLIRPKADEQAAGELPRLTDGKPPMGTARR